jgi:hypothetical protein
VFWLTLFALLGSGVFMYGAFFIFFLVKSLPEVFEDRFVGFGTYDVNRPDGATHWVLVSGKDLDDHLKFVNDLQTKHSKTFNKYIEDRGNVELVHNFTFENLRFYK